MIMGIMNVTEIMTTKVFTIEMDDTLEQIQKPILS